MCTTYHCISFYFLHFYCRCYRWFWHTDTRYTENTFKHKPKWTNKRQKKCAFCAQPFSGSNRTKTKFFSGGTSTIFFFRSGFFSVVVIYIVTRIRFILRQYRTSSVWHFFLSRHSIKSSNAIGDRFPMENSLASSHFIMQNQSPNEQKKNHSLKSKQPIACLQETHTKRQSPSISKKMKNRRRLQTYVNVGEKKYRRKRKITTIIIKIINVKIRNNELRTKCAKWTHIWSRGRAMPYFFFSVVLIALIAIRLQRLQFFNDCE